MRVGGYFARSGDLPRQIFRRFGLFEHVRADGVIGIEEHRLDLVVRAPGAHHRDDDGEHCLGSTGVGMIRVVDAANEVLHPLGDRQRVDTSARLALLAARLRRRKSVQ